MKKMLLLAGRVRVRALRPVPRPAAMLRSTLCTIWI